METSAIDIPVTISAGSCSAKKTQMDVYKVAPEIFQTVSLTEFGMEDMDENIIVVHDDPTAGRKAVAVQRADAGVAETVGDLVGDGLEMRLGCAVADQEEIGDVGNATNIENNGLLGLLLEGDFAAEFDQLDGGEPASALH